MNRRGGCEDRLRPPSVLSPDFTPPAGLARAIQAGVPLDKYARERTVSLNTVYTHLRRIKEKTACKRMSELVRTLNDLRMPLRLE